jgi:non-canonical purine NTP pyrophosphatase, rdgB/HAM1 family
MEIVIASKNKGKIKEIRHFFSNSSLTQSVQNIKWLTFEDFHNFPEIDEGSESFVENAKLKAYRAAEFTGKIALADDSGLEVDALGGRPGVTSSRYAGPDATDEKNRKKLLTELKDISSIKKRSARFRCMMALFGPDNGIINLSEGVCEGKIGFTEIGTNGFGYDSIFIPEGFDKTMAELSNSEKNSISHRGKALAELARFLKSLPERS